jgi:hypothetical protein
MRYSELAACGQWPAAALPLAGLPGSLCLLPPLK